MLNLRDLKIYADINNSLLVPIRIKNITLISSELNIFIERFYKDDITEQLAGVFTSLNGFVLPIDEVENFCNYLERYFNKKNPSETERFQLIYSKDLVSQRIIHKFQKFISKELQLFEFEFLANCKSTVRLLNELIIHKAELTGEVLKNSKENKIFFGIKYKNIKNPPSLSYFCASDFILPTDDFTEEKVLDLKKSLNLENINFDKVGKIMNSIF